VAQYLLRANVLAFSCEAAREMDQCTQNVVRLRLLQRPVSLQWSGAWLNRVIIGGSTIIPQWIEKSSILVLGNRDD